jgi:hypothetical protein
LVIGLWFDPRKQNEYQAKDKRPVAKDSKNIFGRWPLAISL